MRPRSNSPVPTLLACVPLLVMPLLAVFGVPQFVPVDALPVAEEMPRRAAATSVLRRDKPRTDRVASAQSLHRSASLPTSTAPKGPSRRESPSHPVDTSPDGAEPLSWSAAVDRLDAWGIRRFRLETGLGGRGFHFRCDVPSGTHLQVTHRFEAEATEPLAAVRDVLNQIEAWQRER